MDWIASLQSLWTRQLETAAKVKERQFGARARRIWGFLDKSFRDLYMVADGEPGAFLDAKGPRHKTRRNLAREYVNLMMPYVFAQIPHRTVSPRRPPLPEELLALFPLRQGMKAGLPLDQAEALGCFLLNVFLNWTPREYGLANEFRMGLPEALVKGRGVFWHAIEQTASGIMPVTQFDTVDGLLIDPDCEHYRDAAWIARRRRASAWRLAETYRVPAATIRRHHASYASQSALNDRDSPFRDREDSERDVVEYYEVFSRFGVGAKFPGADPELGEVSQALESLGPYAYLVIVPGMKHPLNLQPDQFGTENLAEEISVRLEWPIPLHEHFDPWPLTKLDFSPNTHDPWSASPLSGALPLLVFLDHAYSWLMGRIRATSRDLILCAAEMEEALDAAIVSGVDQEVVTVSMSTIEEIQKYVHVLQFPEMKAEFMSTVVKVEQAFERASGMSALLYGETGGRQMRSAAEADIREGHAVSRPEYMAECVESAMSEIAAKEAAMTRMFVPPPYQLFGETPTMSGMPDMTTPLSLYWAALLNTDDPAEAVGEYTYLVEAGSARRRNKQAQVADMQMLVQTLMPLEQQAWASTGDPTGINSLIRLVGQSIERNVDGLLLPDLTMQMAQAQMMAQEQPTEQPQEAVA